MKIAFIRSDKKFSATLTQWFTGSRTYHVAWVDESRDRMVDMNLLRRQRLWSNYSNGKEVVLVDSPVEVTWEFLEDRLLNDNATYGWRDYLLFALRPFYHLIGKSTRNVGGVICSEMVYNDLVACGWNHRFEEVPSPADLEKVLCP